MHTNCTGIWCYKIKLMYKIFYKNSNARTMEGNKINFKHESPSYKVLESHNAKDETLETHNGVFRF
jgi:hypothetical protein